MMIKCYLMMYLAIPQVNMHLSKLKFFVSVLIWYCFWFWGGNELLGTSQTQKGQKNRQGKVLRNQRLVCGLLD